MIKLICLLFRRLTNNDTERPYFQSALSTRKDLIAKEKREEKATSALSSCTYIISPVAKKYIKKHVQRDRQKMATCPSLATYRQGSRCVSAVVAAQNKRPPPESGAHGKGLPSAPRKSMPILNVLPLYDRSPAKLVLPGRETVGRETARKLPLGSEMMLYQCSSCHRLLLPGWSTQIRRS
jgi:hypothetical protein